MIVIYFAVETKFLVTLEALLLLELPKMAENAKNPMSNTKKQMKTQPISRTNLSTLYTQPLFDRSLLLLAIWKMKRTNIQRR